MLSLRNIAQRIKGRLYTGRNPLLRFYLQHIWKPKEHSLEFIIDRELGKCDSVFFIQIGANDGLINDPLVKLIRKYPHWQGILLEPQPFVFVRELAPLYEGVTGITLVNAALSAEAESLPLYMISFSTKRWATGLAGFVRSTLQASIDNGYVESKARKYKDPMPANKADWISSMEVPCISFEKLLAEYEVQQLQLLQLDTEGYDFEIIKMFPFHRLRPKLISFEFNNLSEGDAKACEDFLKSHAYELIPLGRDRIAVSKR